MMTQQQLDEMAEKVYSFHTKVAPGLMIGVVMVDYACELLGEVKEKLNVIAETQACLSDVIQVMLGCTTGNRYLKVLPQVGRFALTVYDRADGRGVRVYVDVNKIDPEKTPETYRFFIRKRDPGVQKGGRVREESGRKIIEEFRSLGRSVLGYQRVQMKEYGKPPMLPAEVCSGCGESYLRRDETHAVCDVCSGLTQYYSLVG